eukprot:SAG11_NODE_586_length_8341_cov_33.741204_6_plen_192_part_00
MRSVVSAAADELALELNERDESLIVFRHVFRRIFAKAPSGVEPPSLLAAVTVKLDGSDAEEHGGCKRCKRKVRTCCVTSRLGLQVCQVPPAIAAVLTTVASGALLGGVLWKVFDESNALWDGADAKTFRANLLGFAVDSQGLFLGMVYRIPQLDSIADFVCEVILIEIYHYGIADDGRGECWRHARRLPTR